jgi:hypothetical protein
LEPGVVLKASTRASSQLIDHQRQHARSEPASTGQSGTGHMGKQRFIRTGERKTLIDNILTHRFGQDYPDPNA